MIDYNYNEHYDYAGDEIFTRDYAIDESFETLAHKFTFLGKGTLQTERAPYLEMSIFIVEDSAGFEQYVGYATTSFNKTGFAADIELLTASLAESYPSVEFLWLETLAFFNDAIIPLSSIEDVSHNSFVAVPEIDISQQLWKSVGAWSHITRIGGYPSFGHTEPYGQPHSKNDNGELTPLPFLAQYILPEGKFVHIYHVDDPEENDRPLGFGFDNPHRSLVLIEDAPIPEGFCLMPVTAEERSVASKDAFTVDDDNWPQASFYVQGNETDEEYPYTLMHLPAKNSVTYNPEKMLTYADTYIVWNGKDSAKLVEQYD